MKLRLPRQSLRAFGYIFLALIAFGCNSQNVDGVASSNNSGSGGSSGGTTSNGGVSCGTNEFCVNVVPPTDTTMVLHQDGSYTAPCAVEQGADTESTADIYCVLDAGQLDLHDQGFGLNYNVPAGMCPYLRMNPYFYYQYQPGIGPTNVVEEQFAGGGVEYFAASPSDFGAAPDYTFDGTSTYGSPSTSNANQTEVGVDPNTGVCTTNYSGSGGPNCCGGTYTLTIINMQSSPTTVTSTPNQSWGGNPNNCLVGPGVDSLTKYPGSGVENTYPEEQDTWLDGQALNGTLTVASPISKGFASDAYVANYFQTGVTGYYPLASAPNAVQGPNTGETDPGCFADGFCTGNPWYEFDCLDGEENYVARVRVMVRSWTYDQNYNWFVENQETVDGADDPNSYYNIWGVQSLFPDEPYVFRETWVTPYEYTGAAGTFGPGTLADPGTAGAVNTSTCPGGFPTECGFGSAYPQE